MPTEKSEDLKLIDEILSRSHAICWTTPEGMEQLTDSDSSRILRLARLGALLEMMRDAPTPEALESALGLDSDEVYEEVHRPSFRILLYDREAEIERIYADVMEDPSLDAPDRHDSGGGGDWQVPGEKGAAWLRWALALERRDQYALPAHWNGPSSYSTAIGRRLDHPDMSLDMEGGLGAKMDSKGRWWPHVWFRAEAGIFEFGGPPGPRAPQYLSEEWPSFWLLADALECLERWWAAGFAEFHSYVEDYLGRDAVEQMQELARATAPETIAALGLGEEE